MPCRARVITPRTRLTNLLRLFRRRRGCFAVHGLGDAISAGLELRQRIAQRDGVAAAADQLFQITDVALHLFDDRGVDQRRALFHRALAGVEQRLGVVLQLGQLFALTVALPELLGLIDDATDLVLRQSARRHHLHGFL